MWDQRARVLIAGFVGEQNPVTACVLNMVHLQVSQVSMVGNADFRCWLHL